MNIDIVNDEFEKCVNELQSYKNEFTTDELLDELIVDINNTLSEYAKTYKFIDVVSEDFTDEEFNAYFEKFTLALEPVIEKYSKQHVSKIKREFFELCAKSVVLDMKRQIVESTIEDVAVQQKDSVAVQELKEKHHKEYMLVFNKSGVSEEIAKKLEEEFNEYLVKELHALQMDINAKEVDTEENRALTHTIMDNFKEIARKNYGETITEELLEITTRSALMKLKVLDLQNNPFGIQFELPQDATRGEIEIMIRKAAKENPHLFQNKNIDELVDEAMAQLESGEMYNETAKTLMLLEERKAELEALQSKLDDLKKEDEPFIEEQKDDNNLEKNNTENIVIVSLIIVSVIFLAYLLMK